MPELPPQETALVLISLLAGQCAPSDLEVIASMWHRDGKVDFEKPEEIDALDEIGCPVGTVSWWGDAMDVLNGSPEDGCTEEIDGHAKTPIAQLFARARYEKVLTARKRGPGSETLP